MTIRERTMLYEIKGYLEASRSLSAQDYERWLGSYIAKNAGEAVKAVDDPAEAERAEIANLKDCITYLELRIKKLERAFWGE